MEEKCFRPFKKKKSVYLMSHGIKTLNKTKLSSNMKMKLSEPKITGL